MNADTNQPTLSSSGPANGSAGMAIRLAREQAGLSLDEVAARTHLSRPTLVALENDAYADLLEPVYVRGYYRKCARVLGLDEEPLLAAYQRAYTPKPSTSPARLRLAAGGELDAGERRSGPLMILAPIAAIIVGAVLWIALQDATTPGTNAGADGTVGSNAAPAAPISDTMPPLETPVDPAAPLPADLTSEAIAVEGLSGATVLDPTATPVDSTQTADATQVVAAPAPEGTQLALAFEAISWARVEDASGKSLLSGVIGAGEKRVIDGRPPYSVFLGNAKGVKVEFGGQPIDLKPLMLDNATARFSVPIEKR